MIVRASAPGRCGIIGNPSDGYGGTVVSCSISRRAFAECLPADNLRVTISYQAEDLRSPADFEMKGNFVDLGRRILSYLGMQDARMELRAWSDIPFQAGLAGSTALSAAIFAACAEWKGVHYGAHEIAERLHKIEREWLGIQCGYQDHYMAVFGGFNCMDFREKEHRRELEDEIYASVEPLEEFVPQLPFVVAHTGVNRPAGTKLRPLRLRWEDGEKILVEGYRRAGELGRLGKRALLRGDWQELGRLMDENHAIQQRVGGSGEVNDRMIDAARAAGAEGAKLAGAGGGGTIIALATNPEPVMAALREAGASEFYQPEVCPGLQVSRDDSAAA
jgi:galactokinase/mevalonate kinase-like predicted kinase